MSSVDPATELAIRNASSQSRMDVQSAMPATAVTQLLDPNASGLFRVGTVTRAVAGTYDCVVSMQGGGDIACVPLVPHSDPIFGVSSAYVPVEGSRVMVYTSSRRTRYGIIMGVIPRHASIGTDPDSVAGQEFRSRWEQESSAGYGTEKIHVVPTNSKDDTCKIKAAASRPSDLMPGGAITVNEQGVGLSLNRMAATLLASPGAQLRVSQLDDQVRMVSGHFIHFNAGGTVQTFNDGGYISEEHSFTPYQYERSGFSAYQDPANKDTGAANIIARELKNRWTAIKSRLAPKKRIQVFIGHLGGLFSMFIGKPDTRQSPETENSSANDEGLMHMNIGGDGQLTVRAASGISLQRRDRIPIPKRIRQPWDPEGTRVEDTPEMFAKKVPFVFNPSYPYAQSLQLRDALAWRTRLAYNQIWGMATQEKGVDKGYDFYLPHEKDTVVPSNSYDRDGAGAFGDFAQNANRQAVVNIEADGSIVLRDAWGSEIAMRGGGIVITCAGQIALRSGGSTVIMAGDDAIMKARKSVDITATDNDVRVKAQNNLMMVAGDGTTNRGGVLIESKSTSEGTWAGEGEQAYMGGIALKSQTRLALVAANLGLSGSSTITLDTMNSEAKTETGNIMMSAGRIMAAADSTIMLLAGDKTAAVLQTNSAQLVGPSVNLVADSDVAIIKGSTALVPVQWADIGKNWYSDIKPGWSNTYELLKGEDWFGMLKTYQRASLTFTFRSDAEYGTVRGAEVYQAPTYYLYQAPWAYLKSQGFPLIEGTLTQWIEKAIEGGYPWPGAGKGKYVTLSEEINIDDPVTGISKKLIDLKETGGTLVTKDVSTAYEVLER